MKNNFTGLTVIGVFVAGISSASAALIDPGLINDFQDGTTMGWTNGARVQTKTPPTVKKEGDNYYLEVKSKGKPAPGDTNPEANHSKRMTVFNESYDWTIPRWLNPEPLPGGTPYTSDWAGDYSNIGKIEGRVKIATKEADTVFMTLEIWDFFLHNETGVNYIANTVVEVPTGGEWIDFSFDITPENVHPSPWWTVAKLGEDARSYEELRKNTTGIRFAVYNDLDDREAVFKGTMGLDDIRVSAVPLPGAVWMMIFGLLSLGGLFAYKCRHTA